MNQGLERKQRLAPARKTDQAASAYLHPYVCFNCRRSFKRANTTAAVLTCPHCAGPAIGLTRKFKPPPRSDLKQWAKVEALVRHGFLFWSLDEPYPERLSEVAAFATRHADHLKRERDRSPEAFVEIEAALNRFPD
jgi:hypothetical protein